VSRPLNQLERRASSPSRGCRPRRSSDRSRGRGARLPSKTRLVALTHAPTSPDDPAGRSIGRIGARARRPVPRRRGAERRRRADPFARRTVSICWRHRAQNPCWGRPAPAGSPSRGGRSAPWREGGTAATRPVRCSRGVPAPSRGRYANIFGIAGCARGCGSCSNARRADPRAERAFSDLRHIGGETGAPAMYGPTRHCRSEGRGARRSRGREPPGFAPSESARSLDEQFEHRGAPGAALLPVRPTSTSGPSRRAPCA